WMAGRPPCHPRMAWLEEAGASLASRPQLGLHEECEAQPLQSPSGSEVGLSASAVAWLEEEEPLSFIRTCCTRRPKGEVQKLRFLASVCAVCGAALADRAVRIAVYFCQPEVAQSIEGHRVGQTVGQRVPQGIPHLSPLSPCSRAGLLPQDRKNGLLRACLCSIFHLPHHEDTRDVDAYLYFKTMAALDSLLQVLVCSAGASGLLELQDILKLLLPFTQHQLEAVEERAMAQIARLAAFISTCSLPQVCSCFAGDMVLRHRCPEKHRFAMLGRLAGYLLLCCTSKNEGSSHEAAEAVRQLYTFIAQQRSTWPWELDAEQPQLWEHWRAQLSLGLSQDSSTSKIFMMFMKYLQCSERVDVFLTAIESMGTLNPCSTELAAHMVDALTAETDFLPGQVLNIVRAIYRTLPSIGATLALESLDRALLVLASKHPREMVASLLQCSPTCTSVAVTMWRAMLSKPPATEKVLRELLGVLVNQSGHKTSTSIGDHPRILALAAARPIHELLLLPTCLKEVKAIFPQLFLALLFQVSFITELTLQEVHIFWKKHQQDMLSPISCAVQSMKVLLRTMDLESQVLAIEAQGGWEALLSTETHFWGVQVVAREMMELPRALRATIICHLAELLSMEDSSWEMVAMVFLVKMLECTDLGDELDCAVSLFATYLRSPCLGMQGLVLRAILGLTERPDVARKMLVLLPCIIEQLQGTDSDTRAVALPVLSTMLRLLEGRTLSLTALELASNLPPLFDDESSTVRLLSIRLFLDTLGFVEGSAKKKMWKEVSRSLLLLSFHLHDQDKSVAKASREALLGVTQFLCWRQLARLAETAEAWRISECLLAGRRSRAEDYLGQSLPYLRSPQEPLRQEATRFI
ncbi:MROH7 protein, partial [Chauna torquata]|nr:MROH7 protein [Chauna torquata]